MRSVPLGIAHGALAVALVIAMLVGLSRSLPVTATLGGDVLLVAVVGLSAAVAVLSVWSAIARLAPLAPPTARWRAVEYSQVAGVTVFLIAQLNGIHEVTSLVPLYAIASGSTVFLVLSERERAAGGSGRLPFMFGAAVGIVPWGVIAFQQVASIIAGSGPDAVVRVITIVALLLAAAYWTAIWRRAPRAPSLLIALNAAALALVATLAGP